MLNIYIQFTNTDNLRQTVNELGGGEFGGVENRRKREEEGRGKDTEGMG